MAPKIKFAHPGAGHAGYSWNNFILASILAGGKTRTLPIAVYHFVSYQDIDWGAITATATLMTVPVLILTVLIQRHLVCGLAMGAVETWPRSGPGGVDTSADIDASA